MRQVVTNHDGGKGLGKDRKAKRIAFVGAKGGVGASLSACELASFLHRETHSKVMWVDHNYCDSNLDVLLGIEEYTKLDISKSSVQISQLDEDSAQALLHKDCDGVALLAVDGLKASIKDCNSQSDAMVSLLLRRYNLVVEDFSCSREFPLDYMAFCEHYDSVIVVADPTVSAVRSAKRLMHNLDLSARNSLRTPRSILVLNQHRTFRDGVLYAKEIEQQLKRKIDVEVAYEKSIPSVLLSGKRFTTIRGRFSSRMLDLAALVLGRKITKKSNPLKDLIDDLRLKLIERSAK